mmetsp:Transcript_15610/g.23607  ORF Transcript_15610/g.23607 Transcript_15610/m.23607 type:complete len:201 (-) Transcript_15610:1047-1649(-)
MAQNFGSPTSGINSLDRSSTRMVDSPRFDSRLEIPRRVTNPLSNLVSPNNLLEEAIWDLYRTGSTTAVPLVLPLAEDSLPPSEYVLPDPWIRQEPDVEDRSCWSANLVRRMFLTISIDEDSFDASGESCIDGMTSIFFFDRLLLVSEPGGAAARDGGAATNDSGDSWSEFLVFLFLKKSKGGSDDDDDAEDLLDDAAVVS